MNYASLHCWGRNESRGNYTNDLGRATNTSAHALLAKVYTRIASCKRTANDGVLGNELYLQFSESYQSYYQYAKDHSDLAISGQGFNLSSSLEDWVSIFDANNGNNEEMIFDVLRYFRY